MKINKIVLIGCGTAYHSCLVAKYWLEELTSIDTEIDIASEFRYRKLKFNSKNLYIFVSQSGETADTAAALDLCKKNNVKTCSIVNVIESTIARNSDWVLPTHAGPEVGVASTKAFIGQLLVLYILSVKISKIRDDISQKFYEESIKDLKKIPDAIEESLKSENIIDVPFAAGPEDTSVSSVSAGSVSEFAQDLVNCLESQNPVGDQTLYSLKSNC